MKYQIVEFKNGYWIERPDLGSFDSRGEAYALFEDLNGIFETIVREN